MLLLRRNVAPVQAPTGQVANNFRRILFSPPDEPEDTLSLGEWEQIDLRCVHILKTKTLQASCLTRGLSIAGSRDTIVSYRSLQIIFSCDQTPIIHVIGFRSF